LDSHTVNEMSIGKDQVHHAKNDSNNAIFYDYEIMCKY